MDLKAFSIVVCVAFAVSVPANAVDRGAFYDMCHATSLGDGLDDATAAGFCDCLADAASADEAIYTELFEAGTSEPDLDTRLGLLSDDARSAAESCQG